MKKSKVKGLLERKLENPVYRTRFERQYPAFVLEVQILKALEEKGWTFEDLARKLHTKKNNVSRDLSAGGIRSATIKRLSRMAEALGMEFLPLLIPPRLEGKVLPKLRQLFAQA